MITRCSVNVAAYETFHLMEVSDDENGESLIEGEGKQSEPVSVMDANRVKHDKAVEEIQHLKSYLTQLFAQDEKEEYKENIVTTLVLDVCWFRRHWYLIRSKTR